MYLHIGNEKTVNSADIILILDLDSAMTGKDNTGLLKRLSAEDKVIDATVDGLPKSLLLLQNGKREEAYLSSLAASTLLKRLKSAISPFK